MTSILTEEQELMINIARDFAVNELRPRMKEVDRLDVRPPDLIKRAGELGLRGILIPEEWGGLGQGVSTQVRIMEELCKEGYLGGSLANNLLASTLLKHGSPVHKEKYLRQMVTGESYMGFAFTEASAGSDASSIHTKAVKDGDEWILNGTKIFISSINGDGFLVTAKTNEIDPGGISAFIVERSFPGFFTGPHYKNIGYRGSDTAELYLKDCRVPAENMIGVENKGLRIMHEALDIGRLNVAATGIGLAQGAFDRAIAYAQKRVQFGRPISDLQIIQHYAADMLKEIQVNRAMLYHAAALADAQKPFSLEASICKLSASEMASSVTDKAIQICGGYGLVEDGEIERYYRDARVLRIVEGTSEIQKMIISRNIFPKSQ